MKSIGLAIVFLVSFLVHVDAYGQDKLVRKYQNACCQKYNWHDSLCKAYCDNLSFQKVINKKGR